MPEDLALHPLVEPPQRADHLGRAAAVGIGGKADDVGEQHRDVLGADLLERLVVLRQLLDDIGRKITRQIGALAFDPGVADQQRVGAAHRQRECHGDDQEDGDFLKPAAEADRRGIDHLEHPVVGADGGTHAFGQRGVGIGLQVDPADGDHPQRCRPDAHRDDGSPGIGQRRGGQQDKEVDEAVEPELHCRAASSTGAPGIGHHAEEGQQRQIAEHQEKLGPGDAGLADLELGPADRREQAEHHDVIEDLPVGIDDRQRHARSPPARPSARERRATGPRACCRPAPPPQISRSCRTSVRSAVRAAGIGNVACISQYAQTTHS